MTKKGKLIVGEIDMGWGPISPILVDVGTICVHGSPVDTRTVPIPEVVSIQGPFTLMRVRRPGFRLPGRVTAP